MDVTILIARHNVGWLKETVFVCKDREVAFQQLQEYVRDCWYEQFDCPCPEEIDDDVIHTFFDESGESYDIRDQSVLKDKSRKESRT